MKKIAAIILMCIILSGCTDAEWDKQNNLGRGSTIIIYGATGPIKTYYSTGKVEYQQNGTVIYFRDKETNKFVTVSGTFSVERDN